MSGSCRYSLPDVWELSGVPPGRSGGQPGGLGMVETPSRMSMTGGRPSRMFGSVRVAVSDVREWSGGRLGCPGVVGGPSKCPGVVGSLSHMTGGGREALPVDWEWSEGPPGCLGVVGRPSRMSGSGRESLQEVWEALQMSGSGLETLPNVSEGWKSLLDVRLLSGGPPGCQGVVGRPSHMPLRGGRPSRMLVFRRPSRMSGSGRDSPPEVR